MRLGKLRVPLQYAILTWWLSPHYYFEIETEIAAPSRTLLKTRASAYLPHKADINCRNGDFRFVPTDVRFVPILLQKSAYRRRGTAGAFFEAIHCHPLDCAGDLRSTLLTLATLTQ